MITGKYVCSECGAKDLPALFFIGQYDAVRNKNGRCQSCYDKIRNPQKITSDDIVSAMTKTMAGVIDRHIEQGANS